LAAYGIALAAEGIPFVLEGGGNLFEQDEVCTALTLLSAVVEPGRETAVVGALRSTWFALSDDELERMHDQPSSILDHFLLFGEIATENVPPTAQSFELTNIERPDEPGSTIARDEALEGAPRREDGYFRVRAVLD